MTRWQRRATWAHRRSQRTRGAGLGRSGCGANGACGARDRPPARARRGQPVCAHKPGVWNNRPALGHPVPEHGDTAAGTRARGHPTRIVLPLSQLSVELGNRKIHRCKNTPRTPLGSRRKSPSGQRAGEADPDAPANGAHVPDPPRRRQAGPGRGRHLRTPWRWLTPRAEPRQVWAKISTRAGGRPRAHLPPVGERGRVSRGAGAIPAGWGSPSQGIKP